LTSQLNELKNKVDTLASSITTNITTGLIQTQNLVVNTVFTAKNATVEQLSAVGAQIQSAVVDTLEAVTANVG